MFRGRLTRLELDVYLFKNCEGMRCGLLYIKFVD